MCITLHVPNSGLHKYKDRPTYYNESHQRCQSFWGVGGGGAEINNMPKDLDKPYLTTLLVMTRLEVTSLLDRSIMTAIDEISATRKDYFTLKCRF